MRTPVEDRAVATVGMPKRAVHAATKFFGCLGHALDKPGYAESALSARRQKRRIRNRTLHTTTLVVDSAPGQSFSTV
jgi:hypothetical protein